jgi:4-hydroxybenzoyl-CoA reductase subunit beta
MAVALNATVLLTGVDGEREAPVASLYRDDGIEYLAKQPSEVVTGLRLATTSNSESAYVKLRRRGSIDFPIAGAAVWLQMDGDVVSGCRIALSAVASHPLEATAAAAFLTGKKLDRETLAAAAELAAKPAKPLDNADLTHFWRKRMVRVVVEQSIEAAATKFRGSAVKLSSDR